MTKPEMLTTFDLFTIDNFLDAETCGQFITELRGSPVAPATVYGRGDSGGVDERIRKAAKLMPALEIVERVRLRILKSRAEVGEHFGVSLHSCEEPQFLRYGVGDFFVAHQDGNTGMLRSDREQWRKISLVVFLNRQSEVLEMGTYSGGSLAFSDWRSSRDPKHFVMSGKAGALVAFRSETTHEVLPVTHGERYSIVSWYG